MRLVSLVVVASLAGWVAPSASAQNEAPRIPARSWTMVRFLGGGVDITMDPNRRPTWKNQLSVSERLIELHLADGQSIQIDPARVAAVTYRGNAYIRRALGAPAGLGALAFAALPFLTPREVKHYVGVQYTLPNGLQSGLLIQAHKDNHAAIFDSIRAVTQTSERVDVPGRK